MGQDFTIWQAAACAAALPLGSALMAAADPKAQYTLTQYLLHRISEQLAGQHIPYPWESADEPVADFGAMDIDDFKRWHELKFSERGLDG